MRKKLWGALSACFGLFLVMGFYVIIYPVDRGYTASFASVNGTDPLKWLDGGAPPSPLTPGNISAVISAISDFFAPANISEEEKGSLLTLERLKQLLPNAQSLPNAAEAVKEAGAAWSSLIASIEEEKSQSNSSLTKKGKQKQCPHFLSKINASELDDKGFKFRVPCGLTQGSSITFIGIPTGLLGNFIVELAGEPLPGEPDAPIIFHYNVRLHGDKLTGDPVIVQNTWTAAHDWGEEERCPSDETTPKKVDELELCNEMLGKEINLTRKNAQHFNGSTRILTMRGGNPAKYFPFQLNDLFAATLRVGLEGFQVSVDGKHITAFAFRETLEPWLVSQVRISGDINLVSVVASGLPTSENLEHIDLASLKAVPIPASKEIDLFIGVFSTANNFKHRMSVRRTWMQYPEVRSGRVAVRFFVGLHKNQMVNEELWNEAKTYGDIQLMPFVDYYSLITLKSIAICIFGTEVVSSKFIMKTDDDAFVRVDEILNALSKANAKNGLLYGSIEPDSHPNRDPSSKWYISAEEWPEDTYPSWAHGPGYVVSNTIAKMVSKKFRKGRLKMFKLEDVAMGTWIANMKKKGMEVKYEHDDRIINDGCKDGYVVAHYQGPREMICLWHKLQQKKNAECCGD